MFVFLMDNKACVYVWKLTVCSPSETLPPGNPLGKPLMTSHVVENAGTVA